MGDVIADLTNRLSAEPGYTYQDMAFYDLKIKMKLNPEDSEWVDATPDNFPEEGLTVLVDCPPGTSTNANDFIIGHMFSTTSERLGTT